MAVLTQINIYPIKSMAGFSVSSAYVGETGLAQDRQMMLVDSQGRFVTARKYPKMLGLTCVLDNHGVVVTTRDNQLISISLTDFDTRTRVKIWRDEMQVMVANETINRWFSRYLSREVRLVTVSSGSNRTVKNTQQPLAFADGYPLLIIGESSLEVLNDKASEMTPMSNFRSNLIFTGAKGFEEDTWRRIRIGMVEFEFLKPCERCVMTTVDPASLAVRENKEPLITLSQFRADAKGRLMFGENLIAKNNGVIAVGDAIEVLETHRAIDYGARAKAL